MSKRIKRQPLSDLLYKNRMIPPQRDGKFFAHGNEIPQKRFLFFGGSSTFVGEVPMLLEEFRFSDGLKIGVVFYATASARISIACFALRPVACSI